MSSLEPHTGFIESKVFILVINKSLVSMFAFNLHYFYFTTKEGWGLGLNECYIPLEALVGMKASNEVRTIGRRPRSNL